MLRAVCEFEEFRGSDWLVLELGEATEKKKKERRLCDSRRKI